MTPRIRKLRSATLAAVPTISHERAVLITDAMEDPEIRNLSVPETRAFCFSRIMERKKIWIGQGELLVGERGPAPAATPTYPEICLHSVEDLSIFDARKKVAFRVSDETRTIYQNRIIPFWQGRSLRDRIFTEAAPLWESAYTAGVFTEFQEQRAPGHTVLGDIIYRKGCLDLIADIDSAICHLDFSLDPTALDKRQQLSAMRSAALAIIGFAGRHAAALEEIAAKESDASRKEELITMAGICRKVPAHKPETFWEALQAYWFIHVGVITELNPWDAFNPGRLDQHLYPFYKQDLEAGRLTPEFARELLMAFWVKFHNHPAPPKAGITAKESNTYVDFALINLGGLTPDGQDGVNPLTFLILDVVEEMRLLQPSAMIQVSKKNPDRFIRRAMDIVKTGFGQPSIFNTDAIIQELVAQGKTLTDARKGGASGCVESGAFGHEAYFLTGYLNLPKILEITLHDGMDPRTGLRLGPATGKAETFRTFSDLFSAFTTQLAHFTDLKIRGNNRIERLFATRMPAPFLSLFIEDCIPQGKDYNAGGARYNTSYIQGVGLGSLTDSFAAIRSLVFEDSTVSMTELMDALHRNFEGCAPLRRKLLDEAPKYGNDDDAADDLLSMIFDAFHDHVNNRPNTRGGVHRINLLPTTSHVYFGSVIGALPDGRMAGRPLSEGISPVQGADRNGPTAAIRSAAKIDHLRTGGTLLNQKFLPQVLDDTGCHQLVHLIRAYFRMDGHHIQFNVVDADTLIKAKAAPDDYRDLIVRVAGYSDYFVNLTEELQEEVIQRTAHESF